MNNQCQECGTSIDSRSLRCNKCRALNDNPFKGKQHKKKTKKIIGLKSKSKFTNEYKERVYRERFRDKKHRDINGYTLIKNYDHPNRNSHNDILEHIKVMSDSIGRPLNKGEIVHHINFKRDDNRVENLYLFSDHSSHLRTHGSVFKMIDDLLKMGVIMFNNGEYKVVSLAQEASNVHVGGEL